MELTQVSLKTTRILNLLVSAKIEMTARVARIWIRTAITAGKTTIAFRESATMMTSIGDRSAAGKK